MTSSSGVVEVTLVSGCHRPGANTPADDGPLPGEGAEMLRGSQALPHPTANQDKPHSSGVLCTLLCAVRKGATFPA